MVARRGDLCKAHLLRVTNVLKRRDSWFPRRPHALARGCFILRHEICHKEGTMEDKLKAALTVYAKVQSEVLNRVFDNIRQTGTPSSVDLAFCLPDDAIAGMPQEEQYAAFLRKFRFLGYAMWKSTCYRQVLEHAAFKTESTLLLERFSELQRRFREGVREGRSVPAPAIGADQSPDDIAAVITENGCTLFQLQALHETSVSVPSDEPQRRRS